MLYHSFNKRFSEVVIFDVSNLTEEDREGFAILRKFGTFLLVLRKDGHITSFVNDVKYVSKHDGGFSLLQKLMARKYYFGVSSFETEECFQSLKNTKEVNDIKVNVKEIFEVKEVSLPNY